MEYQSVGYESILFPKNKSPYISGEVLQNKIKNIKHYQCNKCVTHRFIYNKGNKHVSALQIGQNRQGIYYVMNVFTLSEFRQKGYAKALFVAAKRFLKTAKIYHSGSLSELGKIYAERVN